MGEFGRQQGARWRNMLLAEALVLSFEFSSACADFHALWFKRRVSPQGGAFLGDITIGDVVLGKYAQNPLKVNVNSQIKPKRPNVKITISRKL